MRSAIQSDALGLAAFAAPADPADCSLPEGLAIVLEIVGAELSYPTARAARDFQRPAGGGDVVEGGCVGETHIENI